MRKVFVDTSAFYAFLDGSDDYHEDALRDFRRAQADGWRLVTTNYVLQESWTLIQARLGWDAVDAWRDRLVPLCDVIWVDRSLHAQGEARCRQARERRLSLTDCVSFEAMRREGVRSFLGADEHFLREGFGNP